MSFKDEEISFANEITEIHENILTPFFYKIFESKEIL